MLEIVVHPPYAIDVRQLEDGARVIHLQTQTGQVVTFSMDEATAKQLASGLIGGLAIANGNQLQLAKR